MSAEGNKEPEDGSQEDSREGGVGDKVLASFRSTPRRDMTQHPFILSMLTFLTLKFGDEFYNLTFQIRDSSSPTKQDCDLYPVEHLYTIEAEVDSFIPVDMFTPGFPNLWREEFLQIIQKLDPDAMHPDLMGRWDVEWNPSPELEEVPEDYLEESEEEPEEWQKGEEEEGGEIREMYPPEILPTSRLEIRIHMKPVLPKKTSRTRKTKPEELE